MKRLPKIRTFLAPVLGVGAVVISTGLAAAPAQADRIYSYPRVRGAILDHCWTWARNCGWARAHWYCRARGHRRGARSFQRYRPGRTFVVGSRRYCNGSGCVGYRRIRCITSVGGGGGGRVVAFNYPRVRGAILDHCWTWAQNCGWARAHWYCRARGYRRSVGFARYRPGRTYVVGSRRYCRGGGCVGYRQIRCTR